MIDNSELQPGQPPVPGSPEMSREAELKKTIAELRANAGERAYIALVHLLERDAEQTTTIAQLQEKVERLEAKLDLLTNTTTDTEDIGVSATETVPVIEPEKTPSPPLSPEEEFPLPFSEKDNTDVAEPQPSVAVDTPIVDTLIAETTTTPAATPVTEPIIDDIPNIPEATPRTETHIPAIAQAEDLIAQGKLEEARALLQPLLYAERSLDMSEKNADAWWVYAQTFPDTDQESIKYALEMVVQINPNYPRAKEVLNDYSPGAVESIERSKERQSSQPKLDQAYELVRQNKLDEARTLLDQVLSDDPDNIDALWILAHVSNDFEESRISFNRINALDPNYVNKTYTFGLQGNEVLSHMVGKLSGVGELLKRRMAKKKAEEESRSETPST